MHSVGRQDSFRLEQLEQRLLLSADPILTGAVGYAEVQGQDPFTQAVIVSQNASITALQASTAHLNSPSSLHDYAPSESSLFAGLEEVELEDIESAEPDRQPGILGQTESHHAGLLVELGDCATDDSQKKLGGFAELDIESRALAGDLAALIKGTSGGAVAVTGTVFLENGFSLAGDLVFSRTQTSVEVAAGDNGATLIAGGFVLELVAGTFVGASGDTGVIQDSVRLGEGLLVSVATEGGVDYLTLSGSAEARKLTVRGQGGDDTLVLDFNSGNPVPEGGLHFDGGDGFDTIVLDGGTHQQLDYLAYTPHSGEIRIDGSLISYERIEPITDLTTAATFNFVSPNAGDDH